MQIVEELAKVAPARNERVGARTHTERAIARAEKRPRVVRLASLWPRLVCGRFVIRSFRVEAEICELVLGFKPPAARTPMERQHAQMMQAILVGVAENAIAIDRGMSCSGVSILARRLLRQLGLDCTMMRAPLPLAVVAGAHRSNSLHYVGLLKLPRTGAGDWMVRMARPDAALRKRMTQAEFAVAQCVMAGDCRQAIAAQREVSERTIANQLHSIFVKLGVCGRFELIHSAVTAAEEQPLRLPAPSR